MHVATARDQSTPGSNGSVPATNLHGREEPHHQRVSPSALVCSPCVVAQTPTPSSSSLSSGAFQSGQLFLSAQGKTSEGSPVFSSLPSPLVEKFFLFAQILLLLLCSGFWILGHGSRQCLLAKCSELDHFPSLSKRKESRFSSDE